jgi:hypothetical protein
LVERLLDALDPPGSAIDRMTDEEFAAELARRAEEDRGRLKQATGGNLPRTYPGCPV